MIEATIRGDVEIGADVSIGKGTKVWQFAGVIRGARIGRDCVIGSSSIVDGATLGDRCRVGHGASIHPGARIGNDVFVGPGAVICNDMWPETCKDGWDLAAVMAGDVVVIEDGASIGANAVILPGVMLGPRSMVAAAAVVCGDVPADHVYHRGGIIAPKPVSRPRMRFVG